MWTEPLPWFPRRELACPLTGEIRLHDTFAAALPALRMAWGPLTPSSVCRAPAHNAAVGGHPRSLHLTENPVHPCDGAMAADLLWGDWSDTQQFEFARLAWSMGWSVGLHPEFAHVDRRRDIGLHQRVYVYKGWRGSFGTEVGDA